MNGQYGFFDLSNRHEQLSSQGDPLERLNSVVDWKIFLPLINRAFYKARKSSAGRKPFNRLMMFKILLLQKLYNLSDTQKQRKDMQVVY
jgi:transposase, IS5 family